MRFYGVFIRPGGFYSSQGSALRAALMRRYAPAENSRSLQPTPAPTPQGFHSVLSIILVSKIFCRCARLDDNDIPPCSPEERWDRPAKFAVMKTGNKRAVRLFDERGTADQLAAEKGEGHYVEFRQGESIRCQSFCLCCRYCNYYHEKAASFSDATATGKAAA
jgi:hypothetical protein